MCSMYEVDIPRVEQLQTRFRGGVMFSALLDSQSCNSIKQKMYCHQNSLQNEEFLAVKATK